MPRSAPAGVAGADAPGRGRGPGPPDGRRDDESRADVREPAVPRAGGRAVVRRPGEDQGQAPDGFPEATATAPAVPPTSSARASRPASEDRRAGAARPMIRRVALATGPPGRWSRAGTVTEPDCPTGPIDCARPTIAPGPTSRGAAAHPRWPAVPGRGRAARAGPRRR